MKAFFCGDIVPGCGSKFVAETDDGVLRLVAEHAASSHGLASIPDELAVQIRSHITLVS